MLSSNIKVDPSWPVSEADIGQITCVTEPFESVEMNDALCR